MVDQEIREELDALKQDVRDLTSDLKSMLNTFRQRSDGRSQVLRNRLKDEARMRVGQLRDRLDNARDYGMRAMDRVSGKVESKPLMSVVIAFMVGIVAGRMLMRRR